MFETIATALVDAFLWLTRRRKGDGGHEIDDEAVIEHRRQEEAELTTEHLRPPRAY